MTSIYSIASSFIFEAICNFSITSPPNLRSHYKQEKIQPVSILVNIIYNSRRLLTIIVYYGIYEQSCAICPPHVRSIAVLTIQGVTKRCRLSWLTIDQYRPRIWAQMRGGGCGVSGKEYSCTHGAQICKLWRSKSIFNLCNNCNYTVNVHCTNIPIQNFWRSNLSDDLQIPFPVPELIGPVLDERFGLVFAKIASVNSGTDV